VDSYFEKGVKLNGTLWSKGSIHFEGDFEGDIFSTNNLVIGKNGSLRGNIKSVNFVNQGSIEGDVHAENKLELAAGSRLVGDISTFHLVIDEGSNFEGRCKMIDAPPAKDNTEQVKPPDVEKEAPEKKEKKKGFWGLTSFLAVALLLFGSVFFFKNSGIFQSILPNEAEYLVNQGNSLLKKSRYEDAEVRFRSALKLSNSNPAIHAGLGEVYLNKKKYREAGDQFQRAVDLKPSNGEFRVKLATAFSRQGKFDNAEKAYRKALEIAPEDPQLLYKIGFFYRDRGTLDSAKELFGKLVKLQSGDIRARRTLGELLLKLGQYAEAAAVLKGALELDRKDPVINLMYGEALLKGKKRSSAAKAFRRAETLFPKNFEANILKADWYFQKESFQESINSYQADLNRKFILAEGVEISENETPGSSNPS